MSEPSIDSKDPETPRIQATLDVSTNLHQIQLIDALRREKKDIRDINLIYEAVRGLKFFSSLFAGTDLRDNFDNLTKLCSNMKYECHDVGKFVFKQGDESNHKFYVILSGEVGILTNANLHGVYERDSKRYENTVRMSMIGKQKMSLLTLHDPNGKDNKIEEEEGTHTPTSRALGYRKPTMNSSFTKTVAQISGMMKATGKLREVAARRSAAKKDVIEESEKEDEDQKLEEFKSLASRFGHLVRILKEGAEFGDAALKHPGAKRTASILCKTVCEFLVLDAETYITFVRNNADKKNQFLLRCFSFLSSVSSSQVKSKILYSFVSEGFSEGHMLMDEGVVVKQPKLFLIEHGECLVERKHEIQILNPLNKKEVISSQVRWLPICTVGPGTLLGEEVLFCPKGEEKYENRVRVLSSRVSVLSILKATFSRIHTELEDQTKLYYLTKKKQRDDAYQQLVNEVEKKKHKNDEFLRKHADVVHMLRQSSFNVFKNRTLRNTQTPSNLSCGNLPKIVSNESIEVHRKHSPTNQLEKIRELTPQKDKHENSTFITVQQDLTMDNRPTFLTPHLLPISLRSSTPHASHENNSLTAGEDPYSLRNSMVTKSLFKGMALQPCSSAEKPQNTSLQTPFLQGLAGVISAHVDNETTFDESKSIREVLASPKKAKKIVIRHSHSPRKTTIRLHKETPELPELPREMGKEKLRSEYLENVKIPEAVDLDVSEQIKFEFGMEKETRIMRILKDKHLKKGVFASEKSPDYLRHTHQCSQGAWGRFSKLKREDVTLDDSIRIKGASPHGNSMSVTSREKLSKADANYFLASDLNRYGRSPTELKPRPNETENTETTQDLTPRISKPLKPLKLELNSKDNSPRKIAQNHILDSKLTLSLGTSPINMPEGRQESLLTDKSTLSTLELQSRAKNRFYYNLLKKSQARKQLNLRSLKTVESPMNKTNAEAQCFFIGRENM